MAVVAVEDLLFLVVMAGMVDFLLAVEAVEAQLKLEQHLAQVAMEQMV